MTRLLEVRSGAYRDSVSLMLLSREVAGRPDVSNVLVAMATDLNLRLVRDLGFDPPAAASPQDMLVAIEAEDEEAAAAARDALDAALQRRPEQRSGDAAGAGPARTIGAAVRRTPDATLALVSTPGGVAAIDAADALASGVDVMVFSDNVSVEDEVTLKRLAVADGLLVMGPDCGTAIVDGVGLGFANVVRPGPVGLVAASGTGAQHVMALLDACDVGVKHCLGVGGRDLSEQVGALSTFEALDRLDADDDVDVIALVSKPAAPAVAEAVSTHAKGLSKPVVLGYLGPGLPDLTETAARVCELVGGTWSPPRRWGAAVPTPAAPGHLRGLFVGGTLCDEAMLVVAPVLGPDLRESGHTFVDFGDDALTLGRPHPMIDPGLRLSRLAAELADPSCAVVLLDVVLGLAAHPDPAGDLAVVIADAAKPVLVSLVGTRDDPQNLAGTAERLAEAGAIVHTSNAAAAREAASLVGSGSR
ncbi:MAG: FdrA protein [Nocardioidaceae bacterium]|nr:FdrA protein [Nocardioidaceae bacterium]